MQWTAVAFVFARFNAGKSIEARMAMIAITTNNSNRVKASEGRGCLEFGGAESACLGTIVEFTTGSLKAGWELHPIATSTWGKYKSLNVGLPAHSTPSCP